MQTKDCFSDRCFANFKKDFNPRKETSLVPKYSQMALLKKVNKALVFSDLPSLCTG